MSKQVLKGYRVRVVVDIPVWDYNREHALKVAEEIAKRAHSSSVSEVLDIRIITEGPPDNQVLFGEKKKFNPSERLE